MNWKMKTLKVRLSSKSDCVLCISETKKQQQFIPKSHKRYSVLQKNLNKKQKKSQGYLLHDVRTDF